MLADLARPVNDLFPCRIGQGGLSERWGDQQKKANLTRPELIHDPVAELTLGA
ncbi:unnamed protein product [Dovyalis caffra]|uniref:Uncharacterized protein n=1 Tax=Dovyalis caffra TaxID=77055 RepID=A0AAV1S350_9ROSI|nr:unnamed protein product [Dovyalis caffra]